LKQHFDEAFEFIEQARVNNSKVLVHCQAGISRSPTLVIAYLMKKLNISMDDAYSRVREKRSIIAPNIIFMSQLMDFEAKFIKNNRNLNEFQVVSDDSMSSSPESTDGNGFPKFSDKKINASKPSNTNEGMKQPIMVFN
jgi:protein tyrosine phosphatase